MQTIGVALIKLLEDYNVQHVFGIPGVHTIELYRGLADSSIVHYTPRHEQGAGFMADGYARVSGKPGVCFVITGPGLTNIATAMGQALADSIPMLIISSVNDHISAPVSQGNLHEMPNQSAMISTVSRHSQTIMDESELARALAVAFSIFLSSRPGPVHLQLPISLLGKPVTKPLTANVVAAPPPSANSTLLDSAATLLQNATAPVLMAGGGARHAAAEITALAEVLDAPAHMTINARGIVQSDHPLALPASGSTKATRSLLDESDVVLAIGTELAPTDYDMFRDHGFDISGKLIRCDIDASQIHLNLQPDMALIGDAKITAQALTDRLHQADRDGAARTKKAMDSALSEFADEAHCHLKILQTIQQSLPDSVLVGDSTQLIYSGNMIHNTAAPNQWFNSSVGFGTLGYALPAAIGASIANNTAAQNTTQSVPPIHPTQDQITISISKQAGDQQVAAPVVCLIGDGGLQFVLGELGTLKDSNVAVAIIVWCNNGYREIKTSMENAGVTTVGVDLVVPDFAMVANAYGIASVHANTLAELSTALDSYRKNGESIMIVVDEQNMLEWLH